VAARIASSPATRPALAGSETVSLPVARQFAAAIAACDFRSLGDLLVTDARLRYLVPGGPGDVAGATEIAAKFAQWFDALDTVDALEVLAERIADRTSLRYRYRTHGHDGWGLVEQQLYLDVDPDGRISRLDVLCSGFRPMPAGDVAAGAGVHHFDARAMGCADGLADEFRRRITGIPVGDLLVVVAADPAAKEDLPPLARMLGQLLHSTEATPDGRHQFTIERTK
jgi:TusA-related sulfurtransferase